MLSRVIITLITFVGYFVSTSLMTPAVTLLSGQNAVRQFQNSDVSYLQFSYFNALLSGTGLVFTAGLFIILGLIWIPFIMKHYREVSKDVTWVLAIIGALFLITPQPAKAYFAQTEVTEAYTILPNESAFWIPDVGNNKDSQGSMDSADYLRANKIALKRFIVPHTKLNNSGGWAAWDYYVPTGRLIILDRSTFSREWVDHADRGTSTKKEGFPCQSSEGLNIAVGVTMGASVSEDDSPKFLAKFGVTPPKGNRNDGNVIFTSVYYGRSLTEVMDGIGRHRVQTLVCNEISKRTLVNANKEASVIMDFVRKGVEEYFKPFGVNIDFIGWADTFTFDDSVQRALNHNFEATQEAQAAQSLAPYVATIQAVANAEFIRAFGNKTDGRFPTTYVNPMGLGSFIGTAFGGIPGAVSAPKGQ